ncbi:MAG: TetR/AcrR family transcriptional regulator [Candidatus Methanomethylophilus sp.]|nr:TetR/AcrR family transcriptional regulator [Methanomethylophilus sp.]
MAKAKLSVQEKRDLARWEIMESSMELFYNKGYEATTTREIVAKAGILNGSLYNRFKNKDEILVSMIKEALTQILDRAAPIFDKERNILLAASFPGAVHIYLAHKSQRIADMLYKAHRMWPAVENYVELYTKWAGKYLSDFGFKSFDESAIRMGMISLIGSVGNQVGYYAHGGTAPLSEALRHHVSLMSMSIAMPPLNLEELIAKLVALLDSFDLSYMGYGPKGNASA